MDDRPLTIAGLSARAVIAPLARPIATASGTIPSAPLVLIDLETKEGVTGSAYIFGYTPLALRPLVELLSNLAPLIEGKPVAPAARTRDLEGVFQLLGRQGLLGMALSGIDMALWDAAARASGLPMVEMLGGEAVPVPAYDSYGFVDPDRDRNMIEAALKRGFKGIKIKLGGGALARDLDVCRGVREIVGPDVALMVDYNQSLSVPEAILRCRALAPFDIAWLEEPVPAEDLAGHARVRAAGPLLVQTGENWWFPEGMALSVAAGASDFAMPDIMKIGGVTGWQRAAAQAGAASLPVSSHLFVEASAHVMPVTPTAHWLEYLDVAGTLLKDPPEIQDGSLRAKGPGLGLDWDEAAVRKYAA